VRRGLQVGLGDGASVQLGEGGAGARAAAATVEAKLTMLRRPYCAGISAWVGWAQQAALSRCLEAAGNILSGA